MTSSSSPVPASILIVGSGVFGLTTAYSLARNPAYSKTTITVVDRQGFPSPDASSIDTSRIIRPDYADPAYAALAYEAQDLWRGAWGADGRYTETGLCLTAEPGCADYVNKSLENVRALEAVREEVLRATAQTANTAVQRDNDAQPARPALQELRSAAEISRIHTFGGTNGSVGYVNWTSGWADPEASMAHLQALVAATGRVAFVRATVTRLLFAHAETTVPSAQSSRVLGAALDDGRELRAEVTVVAAGAWSGALLDLRGIVEATGQALAYVDISADEQAALGKNPTVLNLATGMFVIPPSRRLLKLARHGHGYSHYVNIAHPELPASANETISVSLPRTHATSPALPAHLPAEAEAALRKLCQDLVPSCAARPFRSTRLCYYADTRDGDFLITHHPAYGRSLFVATGGSGHGFKFLPVIGDRIVQCLEGRPPAQFRDKWAWPKERVPFELWKGDGSRGGRKGMRLEREYAKGARL
ncbi:uncharacterized protein K452DRAFT_292821 [Aplosporella prunicola CBS 121167]|uniref:FAD dependent oxidoreductase domain-containing protein n=1 Tax=Aplosporella prunicola CBS 121167 TaxID=1176127 RepID=A0A6A6AXM9_9PEZI|nr:uncharacterized protein K452DRAFT_292821 [Aplosporella prunicola CBS 121167]KAF2135923.1 hypothetical protein K452DRAFT_292821 [Aplosporella prunicola CBS 121167]